MLTDRTNETIALSLHEPARPAELYVDADSDSSFSPSEWVDICITDVRHDSDNIKLTYAEAGRLHDRLGLILGRSGISRGERA